MPAIGQTDNTKRSALALEDISERLAEMIEAKAGRAESHEWVFTVNRDKDGFIQTITVTPNGTH